VGLGSTGQAGANRHGGGIQRWDTDRRRGPVGGGELDAGRLVGKDGAVAVPLTIARQPGGGAPLGRHRNGKDHAISKIPWNN